MNRALILIAFAASFFCGKTIAGESALREQLAAKDGWVGYHVPIVQGAGAPCCASRGINAGCNLDARNGTFVSNDRAAAGSGDLAIYWHVTNGKPDQVRAFAANCPVTSRDEIRWIDPVGSKDSVAVTAEWIGKGGQHSDSMEFPALALQAEPGATRALIELAAPSHALDMRKEAIFWLGQARGVDGANFVEKVANGDRSIDLREHAVFALSQSQVDDAYERVRAISKNDTFGEVRSKAFFWMAQMADPRAGADITAALLSETSADAREQAVFALSQLDSAEATTALIAVIRGNHPRSVKEKALFWLGQAGTDEGMAFIDGMLTK